MDVGDPLKYYVIIKGLVTNFQQAWSRDLGKALSSDVFYFTSRKSLLSGHQMTCRSSQGLALSLGVSCEHMDSQHQDCSAVLDRLFSDVEESSSGGVFLNR